MYIYVSIIDPLKGSQRLSSTMAFLKSCCSQIQVINNTTIRERKNLLKNSFSLQCMHDILYQNLPQQQAVFIQFTFINVEKQKKYNPKSLRKMLFSIVWAQLVLRQFCLWVPFSHKVKESHCLSSISSVNWPCQSTPLKSAAFTWLNKTAIFNSIKARKQTGEGKKATHVK